MHPAGLGFFLKENHVLFFFFPRMTGRGSEGDCVFGDSFKTPHLFRSTLI